MDALAGSCEIDVVEFDLSNELDDEEWDALEELFEHFDESLEWVEGLFTACFVGPELVPPSSWLPLILGDHRFETIEEAQGALPLLQLLYNDVGRRLDISAEEVCPPADEIEEVAEFAKGFLTGTRLQPTWAQTEEGVMFLLPFGALAGALPDEDIELTDPTMTLDAWKEGHRESIGETIEEIRAFFRTRRKKSPARAAAKVGRNDPCPCGSGKKHKKCCAN